MNNGKFNMRFVKYTQVVLAVMFLVILAGGVVRTTGSGMGCPDWPKCFGLWVPPTCSCQLPADYKQKYAEKRMQKNERVAKFFKAVGNEAYANQILNDPKIKEEQEFNPVQTWTEYINRLLGALFGVLMLIHVVLSFRKGRRIQKAIPWLSLLALVMTGAQAFLGSLVVSTNLDASMINWHLFLALAIGIALCFIWVLSDQRPAQTNTIWKGFWWVLGYLVIGITIQLLTGTEVRVALKGLLQHNSPVIETFYQIGSTFLFHRSFSISILLAALVLFSKGKNYSSDKSYRLGLYTILIVAIMQSLSGIAMIYVEMPAIAQATHILFASILYTSLFFVAMRVVFLRVILNTHQSIH